MIKMLHTFSGFSVKDREQAKIFYSQMLDVDVSEDKMGLTLKLTGGNNVFVYAKPDHQPATFTVLNFVVADINTAVDELAQKGVQFEEYDFGNGAKTDQRGVMRGIAAKQGPDIAWFKDPSGNVLSILQEA
jgi:predicted enzyme related to lactoylglutathione lyase